MKLSRRLYLSLDEALQEVVTVLGCNHPGGCLYLDATLQEVVKDVCPTLHALDVSRRGISAAARGDRVHKTIQELLPRPQQVRLHKLHHAVVCSKVKLQ